MRLGINIKRCVMVSSIVVFVVLSLSIIAVSSDQDFSDAITTDKLLIKEGETYSGDVDITEYMVVDGTYTGNVRLVSGSTVYAEIYFNSITGFEVHVNSGSPYITGEIMYGESAGTFTIISGNINLGNDTVGFTGTVSGGSGNLECNNIVGTQVAISDSSMVVSGDTDSALGIGFTTVASSTIVSSNLYTSDEEITVTGIIGNELLDNNFKVVQRDSTTYLLTGTLSYIDRSGGSSIGTFFDLIVGDNNSCTHAVIIATSGKVTVSDTIIDLGGGQYLVCLSSSVSSIEIGDYTVRFSGLILAPEGQSITPDVSGIESSITFFNNVNVDDLIIEPSVALIIGSNAIVSVSSDSDLAIYGSMNVLGTVDLSDIHSVVVAGTIISSGTLETDSTSSDLNIQSPYYKSENKNVYTTINNCIQDQTDGKVYISGSVVIDYSFTIPSDVEIINNGTFYIDANGNLTNEGTFTNMDLSGIIIANGAQFYNYNGILDNSGFLMAYGMFTNKGAFTSKFYADVSYYNNTTTRFGSLPVMMESASSGDSIVLRRNVTLVTDALLPSGVTLSTNSWTFNVAEGVVFNVNGMLEITSNTTVQGTIYVSGGVNIRVGSTMYVSGIIEVPGTLTVGGVLNADKIVVTGTLTVTGKATVDEEIQVGIAPSNLPYSNDANIKGNVGLSSGAIAVVYGTVTNFNPSSVFEYNQSTEFIFENDTYAVEYSDSTVTKLVLLVPKITDVGFAQWLDPNGDSISGIHYVGDYEYVVADTTTETFTVTLTYNAGIVWVFDGIRSYQGGETISVPYGEHYIEIQIVEGYSGTPVLYFDGVEIAQDEDFMIIQDSTFTVTGVNQGGGGGSSDNGLTIILVSIVIIAVILIMLMLYLLIRKNKRRDVQ